MLTDAAQLRRERGKRWLILTVALAGLCALHLAITSANAAQTGPVANATRLQELARTRFGQLSDAELRLIRGAPQRNIVWFGPSQNPDDPSNDPAHADRWGADRTIRADVLRWLATDPDASRFLHPSGIGFIGARIAGALDLSYQSLRVPLTLIRCAIPDGIDISYAETRGLDFRRSRVGAIEATSAIVHGDLVLSMGDYGAVDLFRAQIDGMLDCSGARIAAAGRDSLAAVDSSIRGDATFHDGFTTSGVVDFRLAHIAGALSFNDAHFIGTRDNGLDAERATIDRIFYWVAISRTARTRLNLEDAKAAALWDDQASWPAAGNLFLNGFVYGGIDGGPTDAESRLRWLGLQLAGYTPQPYRQLAKVLQDGGHNEGAIDVLIAKDDALCKFGGLSPARRLGMLALGATLDYGYRPLKALWWMLGFVLAGALVFGWGYRIGVITPTDEVAFQHFVRTGHPPEHEPTFHSLVYSLENFLPLVDLHQGAHWRPNPQRTPRPIRLLGRSFDSGKIPGSILRWYLWLHILAGWVLTPLFVAGLSGLVRSE